jgi:GNAT superfamily N-acetyltransferase
VAQMAEVVIRDAHPEEYAEVGALTVAAYEGLVTDGYREVLRDVPLRAAESAVMVGELGGAIAGTVTLVPPTAAERWRNSDQPDVGTIRMMGVAPKFRGRGVGSALVAACIDRSRDVGWRELALVTTADMRSALPIYLAAGFVRDQAIDKIVNDDMLLLGYRMRL